MRKVNKKYIALSIVAIILVLLTAVSATFAWIDDIKQVEFKNDNLTNGAPLKSGVDINSTVNITRDNDTINLGNMLADSDLTFLYPEDAQNATSPTRAHVRYEDDDSESFNSATEPSVADINAKKGYFYESGNMHLAGCYGDGENFFFPLKGGQTGFREGNKDDENVNYISFTTKVCSPTANVDFWFESVPYVSKHEALQQGHVHNPSNNLSNARFAIIVDGECHVYSADGTAYTVSNGAASPVTSARKTSAYTYGNEDNVADNGANGNVLFSIKRGATVNLTIKIWLESGFSATNLTTSDINLCLVSSMLKTKTLQIVDRTTTNSKKSWLNDADAKLYLTCPSVLESLAQELNDDPNVNTTFNYANWNAIKNQTGYNNIYTPFYELTIDTELSTDDYDVYTVPDFPLIYNNEEMIVYRCKSSGWDKGSHSGITGNNAKGKYDDHGVHYYNWWRTVIPNTYETSIYTFYGGSHDEYAGYIWGNAANSSWQGIADNFYRTYLGYGSWGEVVDISVNGNYNSVDWASYNDNSKDTNIYVRDFTDYEVTGETYIHTLYYDSSKEKWTGTIPKTSNLLQLVYTRNSIVKGCYGYRSYNGNNPQQRPLGSTEYQITFKNDNSNSTQSGIGYWKGANLIYLIANGYAQSNNSGDNFVDSANQERTKYNYIYYEYYTNTDGSTSSPINNAAFPGTAMTLLSGTLYQNQYKVYKSESLTGLYPNRSVSGAQQYNNDKIKTDTSVIFALSDKINGHSNDIVVYPGCYYSLADQKWLGSLNGIGRVESVEEETGGGTGGGEEQTGGTPGQAVDDHTTAKSIWFKLNGKEYQAYQKGSNNSYKCRIAAKNGDNHTICLVGTNKTNYGVSNSEKFTLPWTGSYNINSNQVQSFNLYTGVAGGGNYIITFTKYSDTTFTLTSIVKDS